MNLQTILQQSYQFVTSPGHLLILAWLGSVAISKMPAPAAKSSALYTWAYGVCQVVGANLEKSTISLTATAPATAAPVAAPAAVPAQPPAPEPAPPTQPPAAPKGA